MDHQFNLNSQLEYSFGVEFKKCWNEYREIQNKILDGELPINYGEKERNINTFNIIPDYNESQKNDENDIDIDESQYINSLETSQNNLLDKENNDQQLENDFIQEQKSRGELNNVYYNHYLTEEEDFKEQKEINTINNTEEDEYNNQKIINQLKQSYKNINTDEEKKSEPLININEVVDNRNTTNIYNNQELENNVDYNKFQKEKKDNMKKMKNTISALKKKFLKN